MPVLAVIERYSDVKLQKCGKEFKGLCPFHAEKTPSFHVNPEKNMFYCFGCNAGGDAVSFVSQLHGLKPIEAARMIAGDFGVRTDRPLTRDARAKIAQERRKRELKEAFDRWCSEKYIDLCSLWRAIHSTKAVNWLDRIPDLEADLDVLLYGNDTQKLQLFQGREDRPWLT